MTERELIERVRPLLTDAGWHAVVDGYPEGASEAESRHAMWGYAMGAAYAIAQGDGLERHDAADLAFRAVRRLLADLGAGLEGAS